jgi:hypothetical protein
VLPLPMLPPLPLLPLIPAFFAPALPPSPAAAAALPPSAAAAPPPLAAAAAAGVGVHVVLVSAPDGTAPMLVAAAGCGRRAAGPHDVYPGHLRRLPKYDLAAHSNGQHAASLPLTAPDGEDSPPGSGDRLRHESAAALRVCPST